MDNETNLHENVDNKVLCELRSIELKVCELLECAAGSVDVLRKSCYNPQLQDTGAIKQECDKYLALVQVRYKFIISKVTYHTYFEMLSLISYIIFSRFHHLS